MTSSQPARWRHPRHHPGLPDPDQAVQVWAMAEDAEGTLWIGTKFGLVRRTPDGRLHQYRVSPRSTTDHVWALLFDRDGRLWIGHQIGLIVFKPDRSREGPPDASTRPPTSSLAISDAGPGRRLPLHGRVNLPADRARLAASLPRMDSQPA